MISGSTFLPAFSPFVNATMHKSASSIRDAVDVLNTSGGSVLRLCATNTDSTQKVNFQDQYKRAIAGVKHHIVVTAEGDLVPLDKDHAPSDIHEFIGLRLPDELYTYLCFAAIQPTVLNWLTSGVINITGPNAGGDSKIAQNLAGSQLDPLRRRALTLLAEPIHRYFQTKEISTKLWFDRESDVKFNSRSIQPSPKEALSKWHVRNAILEEVRGHVRTI